MHDSKNHGVKSFKWRTMDDYSMDESRKETTGDRSAQIALTMGLLLFASVILGSGALGDDRDANAADDDDDSRDDANDRVGDNRDEAAMGEEVARLEIACDDGDVEACEELRGIFENRMMDGRDDMRGMDDRRGHDDRDMRGENQMRVPPEVLREMAQMWCHNHVFNTFWENTHAVELDDGSGFEMITYDDDGIEESTVISHDAMWQITSGLEPLVGSCAAMMMELMGVGMPPHDHGDEWGREGWCEEHPENEDCQWDEDDWDEEDESDEWDDEDDEDSGDDDAPCNSPNCDNDDESDEDEPRD